MKGFYPSVTPGSDFLSSSIMASLTFTDLKRMAASIKLSQPEPFMSSMCSEIKFEGYDSSPIFTTPVVEIAGYGMGPAKMGWKGEPLAGTDKLQVPVIPTTEMSEALEEITVQIAKRVQENLVKVRISSHALLALLYSLSFRAPCTHNPSV